MRRCAMAEQPTDVDPAVFTVNELLNVWFELRGPLWKPSTLRTHIAMVPRVRRFMGEVPIGAVTTKMCDEFYAAVRTGFDEWGPVGETTVRRLHHLLAAALEVAVRWDWLTVNPTRRTVGRSVENR